MTETEWAKISVGNVKTKNALKFKASSRLQVVLTPFYKCHWFSTPYSDPENKCPICGAKLLITLTPGHSTPSSLRHYVNEYANLIESYPNQDQVGEHEYDEDEPDAELDETFVVPYSSVECTECGLFAHHTNPQPIFGPGTLYLRRGLMYFVGQATNNYQNGILTLGRFPPSFTPEFTAIQDQVIDYTTESAELFAYDEFRNTWWKDHWRDVQAKPIREIRPEEPTSDTLRPFSLPARNSRPKKHIQRKQCHLDDNGFMALCDWLQDRVDMFPLNFKALYTQIYGKAPE